MQSECCEERANTTPQWPWKELPDDFPGEAVSQLWCIAVKWDIGSTLVVDTAVAAVAGDGRVALFLDDPHTKVVCYDPLSREARHVDIPGACIASCLHASLAFAADGRLAVSSVVEEMVEEEQVCSRQEELAGDSFLECDSSLSTNGGIEFASSSPHQSLHGRRWRTAVYDAAYEELWCDPGCRQVLFDRAEPGEWYSYNTGESVFTTFAVDGRLARATRLHGESGEILIYSATGVVLTEVNRDADEVNALAFAIDGCLAVGKRKSLDLYSMSGEIVWRQPTSGNVTAVAFGPRDCLASGSDGSVTFWNAGGAKNHVESLDTEFPFGDVRQLVYLDDGHLIVSCYGHIALFGPSGQKLWQWHGTGVHVLSGNGQHTAKLHEGLTYCRLGAHGRLHRIQKNDRGWDEMTSVALAMDGRVGAVIYTFFREDDDMAEFKTGMLYSPIGKLVRSHAYDCRSRGSGGFDDDHDGDYEDEDPLSCSFLPNVQADEEPMSWTFLRNGHSILVTGKSLTIFDEKWKVVQKKRWSAEPFSCQLVAIAEDDQGCGIGRVALAGQEYELRNSCERVLVLDHTGKEVWQKRWENVYPHFEEFSLSDLETHFRPTTKTSVTALAFALGNGVAYAWTSKTQEEIGHWLAVHNMSNGKQLFEVAVSQEVSSLVRTRFDSKDALVSGNVAGEITLFSAEGTKLAAELHRSGKDSGKITLADVGKNRFASADSRCIVLWSCYRDLRRVAMFPILPESGPGQPLCISSPAGDDARLVVGTPTDILVFDTGMYPLALLWKPVTACIAARAASCEELFECSPLLLVQPIPRVQYTLLHWCVREDKVDAFKYLSGLCIEKRIWGGLEKTVDGNLLDFAMETKDHDMTRAVLDYLKRTPFWCLLMPHWLASLRKLVVDFPDAFALGLSELLESRLAPPGFSCGMRGPEQLPTHSHFGPLRVAGSRFPSLGQTHYRNSIAPEGDTPISLRALFLPDFQQVWEDIAGLPSVPDAVIMSTVYRASLQQSWQSYGRVANVRTGIFLLIDMVFFSVFAVVTAEHASSSVAANQPVPMLSAARNTVAWTFLAALLVLQAVWPFMLQFLGAIYQRCYCNQTRYWLVRVVFGRCGCVISRCRCCCCRHRCALHCKRLGWQRYLDLCETPFSLLRVLLAAGVLLSWWHPLWLVPVSGLRAIQWEVRALLRQGWSRYWHDAWNFLDWIALLLCTSLPALVLLEIMTPKTSTPLLSITILLLWIRFIYVLRAYRSFGHLIQMIQATTTAMGPFMMLMFIVLVGLSCGWAVLAIANLGEHFLQEEDSIHCEPTDGASDNLSISCGSVAQTFRHAGWQWFASFTLMYRLTVLGDFPGDAFALADFSGNPDDSPQLETAWIAWFFFGFGTLFFLVLLLNLLIAIIGDKYDEMQLKAEPEFLRQRSRICLEAYALELHPRPMQEPYLVMSFPKKFELHSEIGGMKPDLEDEWEGRCKAFERMFLRQESDLRQVFENKDLASEKQITRLQHVQTEQLAHLAKQSEQIARLQHVQSEQMDHLLKQSEKINALEGLIREQGVRCDDRFGELFRIISVQGQAFDRPQFAMEEAVGVRWPRIGDDGAGRSCARRQPSSQGGIGTERSHQQHTMMHTSLPDAPSDSRTGLLTHHVQMAASDSGSDASYANGEPPLAPSTNVPRRRQVNDNSSVLRQQSCDACVRPPTSSGNMPRKEHGAHRGRRSQLPIQMRSSADLQEAGR